MPAVRAAWRALPAALLLALALPAGAQAAATISVSGSTLTFTASDALDHQTFPYRTSGGHLRIDDLDGIWVGASGCTSVSSGTVDCGLASGYTRVVFSFGAGADTLSADDGLRLPVTVDAGDGDDEIDGGDQADVLDGGDGADTVQRWRCAAPARRSTPAAASRAPPVAPRAGSARPPGREEAPRRCAAGPRSPARPRSGCGRGPARGSPSGSRRRPRACCAARGGSRSRSGRSSSAAPPSTPRRPSR
jgi:Ca2+-binding RTX toxin-like protein